MTEILPGVRRKALRYTKYRETAEDCDILLWEATSLYSKVVALATDGPFSHASACVWWESRLMSVGYDEKRGGVAVPLQVEVMQNPERISVFRVTEPFDMVAVKRHMIDHLGHKYTWGNIVRFGWMLFPLVKICPPLRRLAGRFASGTPGAFCSQHIHKSFLVGGDGMYLCRKSSYDTHPNDLGRSAIVRYLGTLE